MSSESATSTRTAALGVQGLNWRHIDSMEKLHTIVNWLRERKVGIGVISELHGEEECLLYVEVPLRDGQAGWNRLGAGGARGMGG